jgi:hypothetical protein
LRNGNKQTKGRKKKSQSSQDLLFSLSETEEDSEDIGMIPIRNDVRKEGEGD